MKAGTPEQRLNLEILISCQISPLGCLIYTNLKKLCLYLKKLILGKQILKIIIFRKTIVFSRQSDSDYLQLLPSSLRKFKHKSVQVAKIASYLLVSFLKKSVPLITYFLALIVKCPTMVYAKLKSCVERVWL